MYLARAKNKERGLTYELEVADKILKELESKNSMDSDKINLYKKRIKLIKEKMQEP